VPPRCARSLSPAAAGMAQDALGADLFLCERPPIRNRLINARTETVAARSCSTLVLGAEVNVGLYSRRLWRRLLPYADT
jgi:hypothetical protein